MERSAFCAAAMCCWPKTPPARDTSAARWLANRGNPCSSRSTSTLVGTQPGQVFHAFDRPCAVPGGHFSVDQRYICWRIVFLHRSRNKIVGRRRRDLTDLLEMAFAEGIGFGRKQDAVDICKHRWRELDGRITSLAIGLHGIPADRSQRPGNVGIARYSHPG